jgi:hypothetical protein
MQQDSAASTVLHVSSISLVVVVLLLLSATGAAPANGDTLSSNGGGGSSAPPSTVSGDITELYLCHMCIGREMLARRVCPGYWPDCHANCDRHPLPGAAGTPGLSAAIPNDDVPCYVAKIYTNGSHEIVQYLDCSRVRFCSITCGGGDVAVAVDDGGRAPGGAAPTSPKGMLLPRAEEMPVCNTQATARARAAPPRGA